MRFLIVFNLAIAQIASAKCICKGNYIELDPNK